MTIFYPPVAGSIIICDFEGYKKPEMVKKRPVVVVSPKHQQRAELCSVVPLSTTPPAKKEAYHYEFSNNPIPNKSLPTWAKCDMLATVGLGRLDRVKVARGDYRILKISVDELEAIRECIRYSLGL